MELIREALAITIGVVTGHVICRFIDRAIERRNEREG